MSAAAEDMTGPEAQYRAAALKRTLARIEAAKTDVNEYIEYTTKVPPRNPEEGLGVQWAHQDDLHREWQQIWTDHRRAIILGPVGTGKSSQLRKRVEWEIGKNPNVLVSYISGSELLPKKQIAALQEEIEDNPRVRHIFPHLKPSRGRDARGMKRREAWSTKALLVERTMTHPDPTVQVFGLFGKILGSRSDIVILDDLINFENSITAPSKDKIFSWLSEVLSRLKPGAKVWALGHIWAEDDALQRLAKKPTWYYKRYECFVVDKAKVRENWLATGVGSNDDEDNIAVVDVEVAVDIDPATMERTELEERITAGELHSIAPTILSTWDILEKMDDLSISFALMMLYNRLPTDIAGRFQDAWFTRCMQTGRGLASEGNPDGFVSAWVGGQGLTYTGVDLGHRAAPGKDMSVIFTAAVLPNGVRQILDVRSGRWKAPEILHNIKQVSMMFDSIIAVENNGAQQHLLDFAEELECMAVRPHNTGAVNKHDKSHGVEALGLELSQGKWMIPCDDNLIAGPEIGACVKACKQFDPMRHTHDHLMAWWICKEAIRLSPSARALEYESHEFLTR